MKKWEYKVIEGQRVRESTNEELIQEGYKSLIESSLTIDKLNQLGNEGWELVSYYTGFAAGNAVAIPKREKL